MRILICIAVIVGSTLTFAEEERSIWERVWDKWDRVQQGVGDAVVAATTPKFEGPIDFANMRYCFDQLNFDHPKLKPTRPKMSSYISSVGKSYTKVNALAVRDSGFIYLIQDNKVTKTREDRESRQGCDSRQGNMYLAMDRYDNDGDNVTRTAGSIYTSFKVVDFQHALLNSRGVAGYIPRSTFCSKHEVDANRRSPSKTQQELGSENMEEIEGVVRKAIVDRLNWIADHMSPEYAVEKYPDGRVLRDNLEPINKALQAPSGACYKVFGISGYLGGYKEKIQCKAGQLPGVTNCDAIGVGVGAAQGVAK